MNKIISLLGLVAIVAMSPLAISAKKNTSAKPTKAKQEVVAKQTIQEATDSLKAIMTKAENGDAVAQNEVGMWYYRGRHYNQDYKTALEWWARAAKQGNAQAIGNMGLCYQTGNGVAADSVMATKLYLRSIKEGNETLFSQNIDLAQKGSVFSNMLISACYQNGIGVSKDVNKAIPFLTEAAKKNCLSAQKDLALILLNGKNAKAAAPWFKKASDNGDISSTFYYGKMLLEGLGVAQDKKAGANYLLKAAETGFPQAMYYVGKCYRTGDGLTKNPDQAVVWLRKAAGAGVSNAQWDLAQCYRQGNGTPINYDQALYWYGEACAKGHTNAFKKLIADSLVNTPFMAYMKGMKAYSNKDFDEAIKQFKIVEKAKISDGKVMEAAITANNSYAKHNMKKGIKLLNDAAKTNAQAMYLLGALYEAGKGVDKDMTKAVEYINRSADNGYGLAECALADMYFEGRGVGQSYEKAVEWYVKAAEQGQLTENAAKRYASCYENGWGGLEVNKDKAEEILKAFHKSNIAGLLKLI
ncbi:tetratricopeptide repeat protein [Bacteroides acidifaciens]|uniref:SEL1-like repeat protein n=1 Tax=Bacteroides acidifaciens TaxID=85831 RepID=UPI0026F1FB7A|nr:tetratricopeptide repeat protein [Bacteroides acidifaciens]